MLYASQRLRNLERYTVVTRSARTHEAAGSTAVETATATRAEQRSKDQHMTELETPSMIGGRIVEAGREKDGRNSVTLDLGHGQLVTIAGMSDTNTRAFARQLYRYVQVEFTVSADG